MHYLILIEPIADGFFAYSPELPGREIVGNSPEDCEARLAELIAEYTDHMRLNDRRLPPPVCRTAFIDVA